MSTSAPQNTDRVEIPPRSVVRWLVAVYAMIFAMVLIGGITRLTGSGLSMVEWRPLMGALPPLSDSAWQQTFDKYKRTPQYQKVNHWMTMRDFKRIFFWEYLHRLFGRLIGVVFIVPWLFLVIRRRLRGKIAWRSAIAFALGGLQGVLGWIMVRSGLVNEPSVSHYRLAAHLILAFAVAGWVLWLMLDVLALRQRGAMRAAGLDVVKSSFGERDGERAVRRFTWALLALAALQVVYGALMAGKRAGAMYPTFPDMYGSFAPDAAFAMPSLLQNLLDNPAGIHFVHRTLAYVVLASVLVYFFFARRRAHEPRQRRAVTWVLVATCGQLVLGALTVLTHVHIAWATAHQALGFLLVSLLIVAGHRFRVRPDALVAKP
ncbi:MAG: COX15/CtaA family protein [Myxococcales bacterium]|nr:COX15/CtaA family protein [Myxococcales bacterium]